MHLPLLRFVVQRALLRPLRSILQSPDKSKARYGLLGFAEAVVALYDDYDQAVFLNACHGACQLVQILELNSMEESIHRRISNRADVLRAPNVSLPEALRALEAGAIAARRQIEYDLPEWIKKGSVLTFHYLARLLHIEHDSD